MRNLSAYALVVVAAGCGGGGDGDHADGAVVPTADAATDGTVDADPSSVSVHVSSAAGPRPGVAVWFQSADSSTVVTATTGADGIANAEVEPGGFATVFDPWGGAGSLHSIITYAGVQPGDRLELIDPSASGFATIHVTAPLDPDPSTEHYFIAVTCGDGGDFGTIGPSTVTVGLQIYGCDRIDVVAIALTANYEPVHFVARLDVPITNGGTYAITGDYSILCAQEYTATLPDGVTANVERRIETARGTSYHLLEFDIESDVPRTAGMAVLANSAERIATTLYSPGPVGDRQTIDDIVVDPCTPYTLDAPARMLPWLATAPTFAAATRTMTWTEQPGGVEPDFALAAGRSITADANVLWQIVGPHTAGRLAFPDLTGAPADPAVADTVELYDTTLVHTVGGYDTVRSHVFSTGFTTAGATVWLTIDPPG